MAIGHENDHLLLSPLQLTSCWTAPVASHGWTGRVSWTGACTGGGGTRAMDMDSAAASPLFLRFDDPGALEEGGGESGLAGWGDGRF